MISWHWNYLFWYFVKGPQVIDVLSSQMESYVWSFDVFFVVSLYKVLNKHHSLRWFESPWRSCGVTVMLQTSMQKVILQSIHCKMSKSQELLLWKFPLTLRLSLQWRHNGRDSVSNHQPHDSLLNRLFRRRSKKTSKLHVTGLCAAQMASYAEMFPFDDVIMCEFPLTFLSWYRSSTHWSLRTR